MTITISIKGEEGEKTKKIDIPTGKVVRGITHLGIFSFVGKEVNRVRPPKRNIGSIINLVTAAIISDAIMNAAFPKKDKEPEVVAEEKEEEVKDE